MRVVSLHRYPVKSVAAVDLDESLVNTEMVELREVTGAAGDELKALLQRHFQETGSGVAEQLVRTWDDTVNDAGKDAGNGAISRFTEVMPVNYRLVLEAQQQALADGLSEEETTARMMEVAARG